MNVVLDTNTVVSGSLWSGAPRQALDLARSGMISLFTSPELLAELADVLGRKKFAERLALAQVSVDDLVYGYAAVAHTIRPIRIAPVILDDPDDDKVLACAKAANAEIITSGDHHLLKLKMYEGIQILQVNKFLERFK
jgi:putative PIN family toxin of toxin-antitoxin system